MNAKVSDAGRASAVSQRNAVGTPPSQTTIRRGDVRRHRAWMTRGYAIGLGAGTQLLTLAAGEVITGPPRKLVLA